MQIEFLAYIYIYIIIAMKHKFGHGTHDTTLTHRFW